MSSKASTVDYIVEQAAGAGAVSARKMFGEYAIYCDGKLVALVCDDQLFVNPTDQGRTYIGAVTEASPYPGAKPCFLIPGEQWDEVDWLSGLLKVSAAQLPAKKPSTKK